MAVVAVAVKELAGAPTLVVLLQSALQLLLGAAVLRRWSSFT